MNEKGKIAKIEWLLLAATALFLCLLLGLFLRDRAAMAAAENGVAVSIHAPYFTNLCNPDPEKLAGTVRYLTQAAQAVLWMGGKRVIFHPGALMKSSREEARERAEAAMRRCVEEVPSAFPGAVPCGDVPVAIGDTYDGEHFYRGGERVLTALEQAQKDAEDMQAALELLGINNETEEGK